MSQRAFFAPDAKTKTVEVVQEIERQTSAEVVVALRKSSGYYRHADYLFGFAVALATLVAVILVPEPLSALAVPLDALVMFVLGAAFCAQFFGLRRLLTGTRRRRENVRAAALVAFHELGISRTTGRWGVLVYLSILERDAEIVVDAGIDEASLGDDWQRAVAELRAAMGALDFPRVLGAMRALGPVLASAHPVGDDDVNELPDELSAT
ncbi:MAG TPA: hypothetical protein DFS52_08845 [Myxococcales bacterium]|nr:hypothetical protein [Myxococcales bacterium]